MTFGVYSLVSDSINYVQIPYKMSSDTNVQQVYVYESTVYACIIQGTFVEVISIDFNTKTTTSIFKLYIKNAVGQYSISQSFQKSIKGLAPGWDRTNDLSVNSRKLCLLSHRSCY
eukprot:gene12393-14540_t